jgi:hypothetical protein
MTLPDERYRAIMYAKQFCEDLLDAGKTPRVPKEIRKRALGVLRHFPDEYYLSMLADSRPDIIQSGKNQIDPLYKMIRDYEHDKGIEG